MRRWAIGSILILFTLLYGLYSSGEESLPKPEELYIQAVGLFDKGKYEEALERFSHLVRSTSTEPVPSYSQYMVGLCYLKMEKYEEAIQNFGLYIKNYQDGDRVKEAKKGIQMSKERLSPVSPPPPQKAKRVKRRICAQIFSFDAKTFEEVEKKVKALKQSGVDTLIIKAFQNRGDRTDRFVTPLHESGVYFKTEYAPVVDDVLGKLAEIVHRNGLELFAWMTTRYADYGSDVPPEQRSKRYNFETKKMEVTRGFNLFHPEVLKRLEGLFRDLARYPIDGILFQDDLILKHNEDFSSSANKAFLKEFGFSPHPDLFYIDPYKSQSGKYYVKAYSDSFWTWAHWKNRWLVNVAQQLMTAARASNPKLQFGINLYYEAVLNNSNAAAWFSQTLSEVLNKDFDYYAVMGYHRQTMKELNMEDGKVMDLMAEVAEKAVKSAADPSRVLMKLQIFDWKSHEVIPRKEVERILTRILNHGEVSLAFVPYIDQFPLQLLKEKWSPSKKK